jgi:hypothetical protein
MTMTDPKPLPPFTLPQPLTATTAATMHACWTTAEGGPAFRRATVDDLRAVLLAMQINNVPEGWSLVLSRPNVERQAADAALLSDRDEWRTRALKAEASERFMRQAPSFARSCVGTGERDEPRWRARAGEAEADLAEILDWAFSKCDSDESEETALAQVQLLWQEMVDECETQAAEIDGLKLLLRKAQAGCPCEP